MDEEIPSHIGEDGTLWVPSEDLPTELTLVSFRRDLLLMPSIMLSRFPKLERSRPVRLKGMMGTILELTEDEISLLGTRQVLTVANGGFVHILPNSDRLREAEREARAVVERALNPAGIGRPERPGRGPVHLVPQSNSMHPFRALGCLLPLDRLLALPQALVARPPHLCEPRKNKFQELKLR
jgi:hypothetical protein